MHIRIPITIKRSKAKVIPNYKRTFFHNHTVLWGLVLAGLFNIANWIFLAVFIRSVDYPIILHYNAFLGVDLVGDWWQAYLMPVMGLIFSLFNTFVAWHFYRQKEFIASYLPLLGSMVIQLGLIIASVGVVLINR